MTDKLMVFSHFLELRSKYPQLQLVEEFNNRYVVQGLLSFSAAYQGIKFDDEYLIQIVIPNDYPNTPPSASEVGERIPNDFHKFWDDTLCLGAPIAVKKSFFENPTLLGFVENNLIPYLYSFSYMCKYSKLPYGELAHGPLGILEYYQEYFSVGNPIKVLKLVNILATGSYRGHHECPCASGKRLRDCHGSRLLEIQQFQSPINFANEYKVLVQMLVERGKEHQTAIRRVLQERNRLSWN